mmetsp:Transcript_3313/g.5014  ORF Transcript_3313/g.5014 Transcript_3313/m.5014 type:complete len:116 (+) Transcript_3313:45-392(+)
MSSKGETSVLSSAAEGEEGANEFQLHTKIIHSDLAPEQVKYARETFNLAMEQYSTEKDVALELKKKFEEKHVGTSWQAIVGEWFGCSLTHKTKSALHFQMRKTSSTIHVLLFQSD